MRKFNTYIYIRDPKEIYYHQGSRADIDAWCRAGVVLEVTHEGEVQVLTGAYPGTPVPVPEAPAVRARNKTRA